ncbi:glycosyltransferase [Aureisphaera sp. CAU 1614]|uniref:Glycosyltransferase n=1 Tax=Halomarinibacterium sedimenti TaxID=2857106 RepID=A0A9X1FNA1_9FLAO|nr:glycosyltransferase family 2 protein [Halomarinibacterium sedimenti]MBW2937720.1 glycosyltransferase [Halomarinibacterium sedimenti]
MPLVSVIVPNYNHECFLEQRIESILSQTFQDFELILLDDASTDGSKNILNKFANHPKVSEFVVNSENSGSPFKQWQKGINLAKAKYIWIAESDDYSDPNFLEVCINALKLGATLCYTQSQDVDENDNVISNRIEYTAEFSPNIWEQDFKMQGKEFLQNYLAVKNVIPNASAVVFKKSLVSKEIFSEEFLQMKMCGDWFFWIHLCENASIAFVLQPHNYFRMHKDVSRKHKGIGRKRQRILEEVACRNYLYSKYQLSIPIKNKAIVQSWCQLHSKWAPFKKKFYQLNLFNIHSISLLLRFITIKIKSK